MKIFRTFLFFTLLSFSFNSFSQEDSQTNQKAYPYEGLAQFTSNLSESLNLKDIIVNEDTKIILKFVIENDGSFIEISVPNDTIGIEKRLVESLRKMPKWKPGIYYGIPVRSTFNLPIILKADQNKDNIRNQLKKYKQETDYFKFNCNCVMSVATSESDGSLESFEFQTLDKIGVYTISVTKLSASDKKNFFKKIISELDQIKGNYKKEKFNKLEALNVSWVTESEDLNLYYRSFFFIKNNDLYTLNFVSEKAIISNFIMNELLNSFEMK